MGTRWLSIAPTDEEVWDKAEKQGYVFIKTKDGFIDTDFVSPYRGILTNWYHVVLRREDYGKTWAFTREELENEIK
mgnify:CR=1 FL=1